MMERERLECVYIHTGVGVSTPGLEEDVRCPVTLCLIPSRQGLSLNLELG